MSAPPARTQSAADVARARAALGLPPAKPNGGWSTGSTPPSGAPWATVPTVPDAGWATVYGAASAWPPAPPASATQFAPTSFRPGNNTPAFYGRIDGAGEAALGLDGVCPRAATVAGPAAAAVPTGFSWASR